MNKLTLTMYAAGAMLMACQPKDDPGPYEPYPENPEAPVLSCQESCAVNSDCVAGEVCSGNCNPSTNPACDVPYRCVECQADADCPVNHPRCLAGACGNCVSDQGCPNSAPRCLEGVCTCDNSSLCAADERCMYTTKAVRPGSTPGCVCRDNSACAGIGS